MDANHATAAQAKKSGKVEPAAAAAAPNSMTLPSEEEIYQTIERYGGSLRDELELLHALGTLRLSVPSIEAVWELESRAVAAAAASPSARKSLAPSTKDRRLTTGVSNAAAASSEPAAPTKAEGESSSTTSSSNENSPRKEADTSSILVTPQAASLTPRTVSPQPSMRRQSTSSIKSGPSLQSTRRSVAAVAFEDGSAPRRSRSMVRKSSTVSATGSASGNDGLVGRQRRGSFQRAFQSSGRTRNPPTALLQVEPAPSPEVLPPPTERFPMGYEPFRALFRRLLYALTNRGQRQASGGDPAAESTVADNVGDVVLREVLRQRRNSGYDPLDPVDVQADNAHKRDARERREITRALEGWCSINAAKAVLNDVDLGTTVVDNFVRVDPKSKAAEDEIKSGLHEPDEWYSDDEEELAAVRAIAYDRVDRGVIKALTSYLQKQTRSHYNEDPEVIERAQRNWRKAIKGAVAGGAHREEVLQRWDSLCETILTEHMTEGTGLNKRLAEIVADHDGTVEEKRRRVPMRSEAAFEAQKMRERRETKRNLLESSYKETSPGSHSDRRASSLHRTMSVEDMLGHMARTADGNVLRVVQHIRAAREDRMEKPELRPSSELADHEMAALRRRTSVSSMHRSDSSLLRRQQQSVTLEPESGGATPLSESRAPPRPQSAPLRRSSSSRDAMNRISLNQSPNPEAPPNAKGQPTLGAKPEQRQRPASAGKMRPSSAGRLRPSSAGRIRPSSASSTRKSLAPSCALPTPETVLSTPPTSQMSRWLRSVSAQPTPEMRSNILQKQTSPREELSQRRRRESRLADNQSERIALGNQPVISPTRRSRTPYAQLVPRRYKGRLRHI